MRYYVSRGQGGPEVGFCALKLEVVSSAMVKRAWSDLIKINGARSQWPNRDVFIS